jgi:hypothetical protein
MATQEREIVDLLWDNDQADALEKLKDMLQVKAAMAVDASKQTVAAKMFPHVPDEGEPEVEEEEETTAETETEVTDQEETDETDHGTD